MTNFEDCPVIVQNDFVKTKSVRDAATELNHKKCMVKVTGWEIKKGTWWTSDHSVFNIETELQDRKDKYRVQRKDTDFYVLRKLLCTSFPYVMVPPLPD